MKKNSIILIIFSILFFSIVFILVIYSMVLNSANNSNDENTIYPIFSINKDSSMSDEVNIKISAVGDCTIGSDTNFGYKNSFYEVYDKNGDEYFFSNVLDIFTNDDITLVNFEGTFTDSVVKREKKFNFKASPKYVDILTSGDVELANLANNHTYDYNQIGYIDTINTLKSANINYIGYDNYYVLKKENINVGFAGIACFEDRSCTIQIDKAINDLKELNSNIIILSFHWGIESSYKQSSVQTYLAHYAIDNGAELVLGHHPHVLQGIEIYKDKYIVYSLGNFVFGGNQNPRDKDTMIFQIDYKFINNKLDDTIVNIYPTSLSSNDNMNDYRPTLLTDSEYDRVLKKIQENSVGITLQ